jgi:Na+/H+-dicarboxylate symporter
MSRDEEPSALKQKLGPWMLFIKLVIAIIVGILIGSIGTWFGVNEAGWFTVIVRSFVTFGDLFGVFLNFIIPLLIVTFVSVGLAELGRKANRLFGVTIACAYGFTVIAGLFAFCVGSALLPSLIHPITGEAGTTYTYETFFTLEVKPLFEVMPALVLAFTLGLGMANIKSDTLYRAMRDFRDIIALVIEKILIPLIPFYIMSLFCEIAASGELAATLQMFLLLLILIIIAQYAEIAIEFGIAAGISRRNTFKALGHILPAYVTALGTKSSAATIPVNLECAYQDGIDKEVADFVIPLCATIHLAGDTTCLVLGCMGIMLAEGMAPTFALFLPFIFMLGIMMIAAPGVPGGGVMAALGAITGMLGFTDAMQQLIISLHLTQDSFGTACNITGDHAIGFVVDHFEKVFEKADERRRAKELAAENAVSTTESK